MAASFVVGCTRSYLLYIQVTSPIATVGFVSWIHIPLDICRRYQHWSPTAHVCSAHFCHLNHCCHSSRLLSIHINHFCQRHHFCQLLSTQSSPVLSQISTTYVATDEVTTFVNRSDHFGCLQLHFEDNFFI